MMTRQNLSAGKCFEPPYALRKYILYWSLHQTGDRKAAPTKLIMVIFIKLLKAYLELYLVQLSCL